MEPLLFLPLIISFFATIIALPTWIKRAKNAGLSGRDMNKYHRGEVAEAGGVVAIAGFVISVLIYIAIKTFYLKNSENVVEIFALLSSVILIAFIGMIDDVLGWKIGLGKRVRLFLVLFAAIPLMVINAGHSDILVPFLGRIDIGWIYPLILIPIGIVGTSTTFNFLAGWNGLEAGQGILLIGSLSLVALLTGSSWLGLVGLCMVLALSAFLFFNKHPASVFPGDVLTYPVGGMIAIMAILGNFEKIALFFFIPNIIEVILKTRGKLKKESFGKPNKDESLDMPYNKIYGLEHFSIWFLKKIKKNGKVYEKEVVYFIWLMQVVFIVLGFIIFSKNIFLR